MTQPRKKRRSTHPNYNKRIDVYTTRIHTNSVEIRCLYILRRIYTHPSKSTTRNYVQNIPHLIFNIQIKCMDMAAKHIYIAHLDVLYLSRSDVYHILTCARGVCADLNFVHIFHGRTLESISF